MESFDLSAIAGLLLSFLFEYVPGLAKWYQGLESSQHRQMVMLGALVIVAIASWLASCYTPLAAVSCSNDGFWELVKGFLAALAVNQGTYRLLRK